MSERFFSCQEMRTQWGAELSTRHPQAHVDTQQAQQGEGWGEGGGRAGELNGTPSWGKGGIFLPYHHPLQL